MSVSIIFVCGFDSCLRRWFACQPICGAEVEIDTNYWNECLSNNHFIFIRDRCNWICTHLLSFAARFLCGKAELRNDDSNNLAVFHFSLLFPQICLKQPNRFLFLCSIHLFIRGWDWIYSITLILKDFLFAARNLAMLVYTYCSATIYLMY